MKVSTVLFYIALGATSARALPTEIVDEVANIDNVDLNEAVDFAGDLEARDFAEVEEVEEFADLDARDISEEDLVFEEFADIEARDVEEEVEEFADIEARDVEEEDFVVEEGELDARANLPGLNALQSKYARGIIAQAKKDKVGAHGCQAGIATALVEVCLQPPLSKMQNDS